MITNITKIMQKETSAVMQKGWGENSSSNTDSIMRTDPFTSGRILFMLTFEYH